MEFVLDDLKVSVKNFIVSTSFADISKLEDDTLIFREGYFDSMGLMSLITFLDENYQTNTKDSDLIEENFESINAIIRFIERKREIS